MSAGNPYAFGKRNPITGLPGNVTTQAHLTTGAAPQHTMAGGANDRWGTDGTPAAAKPVVAAPVVPPAATTGGATAPAKQAKAPVITNRDIRNRSGGWKVGQYIDAQDGDKYQVIGGKTVNGVYVPLVRSKDGSTAVHPAWQELSTTRQTGTVASIQPVGANAVAVAPARAVAPAAVAAPTRTNANIRQSATGWKVGSSVSGLDGRAYAIVGGKTVNGRYVPLVRNAKGQIVVHPAWQELL